MAENTSKAKTELVRSREKELHFWSRVLVLGDEADEAESHARLSTGGRPCLGQSAAPSESGVVAFLPQARWGGK